MWMVTKICKIFHQILHMKVYLSILEWDQMQGSKMYGRITVLKSLSAETPCFSQICTLLCGCNIQTYSANIFKLSPFEILNQKF